MKKRFDSLDPNTFYHIFNRGINSGKVFRDKENYLYFLKKAREYLNPVVDVYAYCLMPNHYHFVVKVKSEEELEYFQPMEQVCKGIHSKASMVSKQFGKLINAYTQAFNKYHGRHGALFERPFKRKSIDSEDYLRKCIIYVHQNPLRIGEDIKSYRFSSYRDLFSEVETNLKREDVIKLFNDLINLEYCHKGIVDMD